jgi:hypothetical protein
MSPHVTFFKEPLAGKRKDKTTRAARLKVERDGKDAVRKADRYCRFPSCGCRKLRLALAVAHLEHKGMGGNPKGDRSDEAKMILLCSGRHRELPISLDMGTIEILPINASLGTRGPCIWYIAREALDATLNRAVPRMSPGSSHKWIEIARERGPHDFEPSTPWQAQVLAFLRGMER